MSALAGVFGLVACSGEAIVPAGSHDPAPVDTGPFAVTDTVPAFYGSVPKNIVLLSIDTLRKDRVGKYRPGATPFLEELMVEGFTADAQMECANWTYMGMTCSVNGRHNEENGYIPELNAFRAGLPDGPTLAGQLTAAGWYTIVGSGNSWFSSVWNNAQGYVENALLGGSAVQITDQSIAMLLDAQERGDVTGPWLLHMHVMEPHAPYAPPATYLEGEELLPPLPGVWDLNLKDEHYLANSAYPTLTPEEQDALEAHMSFRYDAELAWLDDQLRTVWVNLETAGLLDDTLVVVFNDHGEQIWDHGQESHAWALYREENDGVWLFWSKNIVPGAWTGPTSQIDIAPTLLALHDVAIAPEMTGVPLGTAPAGRATFALTSARQGTIQAIRQNGMKLLFNWGSGEVELYDLAADPGEQQNLYDPTDPLVQALWAGLMPQIELAVPVVLDESPTWPASLPHP